MSNLRLCMVSPLYHPELGGVGRQAVALTEYLHKIGIDVFVMCRKINGMPEWKPATGLRIMQINTLGSSKYDLEAKSIMNLLISLSFCFNLMLAFIKNRKKYDIVHFHGSSLQLIFNVIPLKLMGKKIVAKVAGAKMDVEAGSFRGKYFLLGDLFIWILKKVDMFIAITKEIRDDLIKDGFRHDRIFETSNFIMPEKFHPLENPEEKYAIKKRLGIEVDKKIITFSGRLVQRKRVDLLLRAVSKIVKARKDIRVIILGHGELLKDLQGMAPELSICEYVSFKGFVSNILDYLHVADIFVLTSDMEGMPNSLLEAMACGLPVIATRIGGVVDIVEDKKNGLLVAAGDEEELKDEILKLLGDEQLSKAISQEAYKTIRENYYIDKVANKYISLYQRLAA